MIPTRNWRHYLFGVICFLATLAVFDWLDIPVEERNPLDTSERLRLTAYQSSAISFNKRKPRYVFSLPEGWGVKYNGHQSWREASLCDANQQPRMEVWISPPTAQRPKQTTKGSEPIVTAIGQVHLTKTEATTTRPFHSFPFAVSGKVGVTRYTYSSAEFLLRFTILTTEVDELEPTILQILKSAQVDSP